MRRRLFLSGPACAKLVQATFVYATRGNVPDYMVQGGQTYRFVTDHLGSVRMVVKVSDGSVEQRVDYDDPNVQRLRRATGRASKS